MMSSRCLAIITARGGSQRIPRKNIRPFLGRPILSYPLQAALSSGLFEEVMVSTDDQEIADLSMTLGAKVPFMRQAETANNLASLEAVISEVLATYESQGRTFDFFCCLLPTAPFVKAERLQEAYKILMESDADGIFPVTTFRYPIQRALHIKDGYLKMIWPENEEARSQDLEATYHDAGQFYWMKINRFLAEPRLFSPRSLPLVLSAMEVQDIDDEEDWQLAEVKYQALQLTTALG